jgi:LPS-assembly lipoprotein
MLKKSVFIACIALAALTTSCGFKLRGMIDMPRWLNHIIILNERAHADLVPQIQEQLEGYNIHVVEKLSQSKYILQLQSDYYQDQLTSVSSTTTPRQYQIFYHVHFLLQQYKGKVILPSHAIVITRQITINSNRILGSDEEEALIKAEMRRDAAMQIVNQLSKITKEE